MLEGCSKELEGWRRGVTDWEGLWRGAVVKVKSEARKVHRREAALPNSPYNQLPNFLTD